MNRKLLSDEYSERRSSDSQVHRFFSRGSSRNYLPDYLIRLTSGKILVIEVKGDENDQSKANHAAMKQWVDAVNKQGGFGRCGFVVVRHPAQITEELKVH